MKNAGSVHGTIWKALQWIQDNIATSKTPQIHVVCVMSIIVHCVNKYAKASWIFFEAFAFSNIVVSIMKLLLPPDEPYIVQVYI